MFYHTNAIQLFDRIWKDEPKLVSKLEYKEKQTAKSSYSERKEHSTAISAQYDFQRLYAIIIDPSERDRAQHRKEFNE